MGIWDFFDAVYAAAPAGGYSRLILPAGAITVAVSQVSDLPVADAFSVCRDATTRKCWAVAQPTKPCGGIRADALVI